MRGRHTTRSGDATRCLPRTCGTATLGANERAGAGAEVDRVLGNGAGTTVRADGTRFPQTRIDAVEIDGQLTELGRRWFGLRDPSGASASYR